MGVRLTLKQADRRERRGIMAALEQAHCLLWFSPEGHLIDANTNVQSLLGMRLDDIQTMHYPDLTGGLAGPDSYYRIHWARIVAGEVKVEERDILTGAGDRLWCSLTHAPILNGDGQVKLIFTLLIDLSPWNKKPTEGLRRVY